MAYCYNGCDPSWSCFEPMRSNYRKGIESLLDAFGELLVVEDGELDVEDRRLLRPAFASTRARS